MTTPPPLPASPFPSALLHAGEAVAGPSWLLELLGDRAQAWVDDDARAVPVEALPWRREAPWTGTLTLIAAEGSRRFQIAGMSLEANHWLWQFVEEDAASRHARGIVRALNALPDSFTVTTSELMAAASEWATVIDALPVMVVLVGTDGKVSRCNEAFRTFIGLPFASIVGASFAAVLTGSDELPLAAELFATTGTVVTLPRRTGAFVVRGIPILRNNQLRGWLHTLEDITPSRAAATQQWPVLASEQAADGIAVVDPKLRLDYANPALASLLRLPREALHNRTIEELRLLPAIAMGEDPISLALQDGGYTVRHERGHDGGGRLVLEVSISPVLGANRQVTAFVLVVRRLRERERASRVTERLPTTSNLGYWLGGLRHELGNPVNSVKMALTVLHSHLPELSQEEVLRYLERTQSELGRVESLLRALKAFTLYDPPESTRIDLTQFIARAADTLRPALTLQGVQFTPSGDGSPLMVMADPRALHQVVAHLVNNASESFEGKEGRIQLTAARAGKAIELCVIDDGPGIAPYQLARLFLPFETTKRGAAGLGLVLVRELVTAMHGAVNVESTLGEGTKVRVRLEAV